MDKHEVRICPQDQCTGCAVCAGICPKEAISMVWNREGFLIPEIDFDICIGCGLCEKNCPVVSPIEKNPEGICYAAWSNDESIRSHSSSGGLFSELAVAFISSGGCVVGAALDNTTGFVRHTIAETEEQLYELRGSKYVQSIIQPDLYKDIKGRIKRKQKVLFSGCPCQIAAVRSVIKDSQLLYTIDIVCHGVPSPLYFSNVHANISKKVKGFRKFNFRELNGWYVNANIDVEKNKVIKNQPLYGKETHYIDAFLKGILHRQNCYNCNYSTLQRVGDITLADFWGIGSFKPIIPEHQKGCSLVLVNSSKGEELWEEVKGHLYWEIRDVQESVTAGNDQLIKSSEKPIGRDSFYADAQKLSLHQLIKKYNFSIRKKPTFAYRLRLLIYRIIKR